ncbi:MAG: sulfatase-like hydrolase/transferase [Proteobacteria bacterium]|jgi:arylsulfatase A-like enzyme|nr:sulfatase-like hydrolase/transferase [Pseudomonadota bacterium]
MNTARRMGPFLGLLALACTLPGCGNGGRDLAPDRPAPPGGEAGDSGAAPEGNAPTTSAAATPATPTSDGGPRFEPIFGFVERLASAHLRSSGLLIDFGTEARHKYTFGDWRSGWRGDYEKDGTTFTYLSGATGKIVFDIAPAEAGGGSIAIRARAVGGGGGRVYLNGAHIGNAEFGTSEFGHADVRFGAGLRAGRNEIVLRFNTRKPAHDGRGASLAVDYVRVAFAGSEGGAAAAAYDACREKAGGKEGTLVLSAGESLTFNLPIPEGAIARGAFRSENGGTLVVSAREDGGARAELERRPAPRDGARFSIGLGASAGKAVALTLAAEVGDVALDGAGLYVPARARAETEVKQARNLIVILIDTVRADHLRPYDPDSRVVAEQLGRIAAESTVFERAWVQENWTKPSTATLLTGLFPTTHRTKTETNKVPESVALASQHFRGQGFATAAFVANGYVSGKFGFERGWDAWTNYVREGKPNRAQFVSDDVIAWLDKRPKEKRFFLYVHTIDPHVPYMPPREYRAKYDDDPYTGPVEPTRTAELLEKIKVGAIRLSLRDKQRLEALYDGEISYHDDHLARMFEAFEGAGLLDDSLVVITSDHGEEFFDHGSVGHGHSMYEELLHVPLIIRPPSAGAQTARRTDVEVGLVDVLPTACEILAVPCPEEIEGRSLLPLLRGGAGDFPRAVFSEFLDGQRAARMGRLKLIVRGSSTTLFDLAADPGETRDLSDAQPIALAFMREQLGAHLGRFIEAGGAGETGAAPKKHHASEDVRIDAATRAQLEALGYMGH